MWISEAEQQTFLVLRRLLAERSQGAPERVYRLFLAACLRQLHHLPLPSAAFRGIEAMEQVAENKLNREQWRKHQRAAQRLVQDLYRSPSRGVDPCFDTVMVLYWSLSPALIPSTVPMAFATAYRILARTSAHADDTLPPRGRRARRRRLREMWQALICDCFPAPKEQVEFASHWRTPLIHTMAQSAYATSDFATLPVLADALEDAGCTSRALLEHLRWNALHTRGCWALDQILGRR